MPLDYSLLKLTVTVDVTAGAFVFEWKQASGAVEATGKITPWDGPEFAYRPLRFTLQSGSSTFHDSCTGTRSSINAMLRRIRRSLPFGESFDYNLLARENVGAVKAGVPFPLLTATDREPWDILTQHIQGFAGILKRLRNIGSALDRGQAALDAFTTFVAAAGVRSGTAKAQPKKLYRLEVTFDQVRSCALLRWFDSGLSEHVARTTVRFAPPNSLVWETEAEGHKTSETCPIEPNGVLGVFSALLARFPTHTGVTGLWLYRDEKTGREVAEKEPAFEMPQDAGDWVQENILQMGNALRINWQRRKQPSDFIPDEFWPDWESYQRKLERKEEKRAEEARLRQEAMARLAEERRQREKARQAARAARAAAALTQKRVAGAPPPTYPRAPLPPVAVRLECPALEVQETALAASDLSGYSLRERAALWWVSNQSDDLLCLPHCRIERLEYQLRTALRVLGPLRGRALLSDEVGLGKTIEAGLVIKELLTRGMVKRFLVLTVPSLVDQWEEELADKFGLQAVTTNQVTARADPEQFWQGNPAIVASLHTLKQAAQLEVARQVTWDILVVDEAHYLRSRDSQAWQAVNALPRHYLLLLTATPVQNSLEELYNLVTLLQPGQLPSPKEFRARFVDPKRPRQPREPEELRRLLGQVMIRNTRSNAGINLPPRRAETVMFQPTEEERGFWQSWETEFRQHLGSLPASQASLWGRLVLQAMGSSPAAWRGALARFPKQTAASQWIERAPLEQSWKTKCDLLLPLTRAEGGVVIFTQFLETQAALARLLEASGTPTFVINGNTPPAKRQPITEEFHARAGALLLTHSGTEGRNLQFCHRLVNFDLPWNPMELEQRIGRLHRLGQKQPVRIFNFVQQGTLQQHLLDILQEKLNLFELVVGETGLVLGDRFSTDEFAEEVLRRWRESEGRVAEAMQELGNELASARNHYNEVKELDETLFAKDYESL